MSIVLVFLKENERVERRDGRVENGEGNKKRAAVCSLFFFSIFHTRESESGNGRFGA